MKISFVEPHLKLYGGIRRILELSNRLLSLGEEVRIYHPDGTSCSWMTCKAETKTLNHIFKDEHDVIIFNYPAESKAGTKAKARLKVFYILGLPEKEPLKKYSLNIFWANKGIASTLRRSLHLPFLKISNATWIYKYLKKHLNINTELVIGGVNRDIFYPITVKKKQDKFRILCSGDPRNGKGTETVYEVFNILKKDFNNIILDTYYGKNIPQTNMAEKYCSADLFVDAQTYGGWNNPVAEAMACKVPVVCTDIGGVQDFAIHENTALLVPPKRPDILASEITRMIKDEDLRNRLKENAYQHIIQFDWDKSAKRMRDRLYNNMRINKRNRWYGGLLSL